jgi:3-hydroxyisobutyrate dehydrogenase-like beta-hydroxyacid dehydrogenase
MASFGIVGLGRMGSALARALRADGVEVHGFDSDAAARDAASADGVHMHESLAWLADACQVVVTSLPTQAAVYDVISGLVPSLRPGTLLVETSTCGPDLADRAVRAVATAGATFVDAPVSRKAPQMTLLVGGAEGALGDATEPLERVSREIVYCGGLGDGYRVKLLNQYVKYARFLVASEALTFAKNAGLPLPAVLQGLSGGTGAEAGLATADELFAGDADAVARHAPVTTIAKDVELARVMFSQAEFASPSFDALAEFFLAADTTDLRDRPYPEAARLLAAYRIQSRKDA